VEHFSAKRVGYYSQGLLVYPVRPRAHLIRWIESYSIRGFQESQQNQEIEYHVHTLRLRAEQKHSLQLDSSFVPTPTVNDRLSQSFRVSSDTIVKYVCNKPVYAGAYRHYSDMLIFWKEIGFLRALLILREML
jgi:hypothetical protein